MSFTVIIPARFASTRLPGKPLADIGGKPMIQHVYERACESKAQRIVIATDNEQVAEAATAFGAEVCMTAETHESGTDRLQEVVTKLGLGESEIVVNVQGDEPLISPAVIDQVAVNLAYAPQAHIATLCEQIDDIETVLDPNAVKVVYGETGLALYFSRAPIPWPRDAFDQDRSVMPEGVSFYRHIGIYAYRVAFLHEFVSWPLGRLEATEKLEQLRAMEHGRLIHVAPSVAPNAPGVDTQQDLERVREILKASQ